nr:TIM barrel protein [Sandaracinobacteroides sayramensis]
MEAFVRLAAEAGYTAVDIFVRWRPAMIAGPAMIDGAQELQEVRAILADNGLVVSNLESFPIVPEFDWQAFERAVALGGELGARSLTMFLCDPDMARGWATLARAAELAASHGLWIGIETTPINRIPRLTDLARAIIAEGIGNLRCVVDILHAHRNGEGPADMAEIAPGLVGGVQVMDAPLALPGPADHEPFQRRMMEALTQRLFPGEGELPLAGWLAALPAGAPLSLEVPHARAAEHMDASARARAALCGLRAILAQMSDHP